MKKLITGWFYFASAFCLGLSIAYLTLGLFAPAALFLAMSVSMFLYGKYRHLLVIPLIISASNAHEFLEERAIWNRNSLRDYVEQTSSPQGSQQAGA